jgi:hypothetical protein
MSNLTVEINGREYPLATTLRVAYKIQGQHNHKPYTEVFKQMGDMHVEDQIGIMYAAFECANPKEALTLKRKDFENYYLDNYNLKDLMNQLQGVIKGIMGEDFFEDAPSDANTIGATNLEDEEDAEAKN